MKVCFKGFAMMYPFCSGSFLPLRQGRTDFSCDMVFTLSQEQHKLKLFMEFSREFSEREVPDPGKKDRKGLARLSDPSGKLCRQLPDGCEN